MKDVRFPLSEIEKVFKQAYDNGGQKLLESPMTYHHFESLDEKRKHYYDHVKNYHETISSNMLGHTIKEVGTDGEKVDIVLHGRYCYPLMHNHAYIEVAYVYSGSCIHFVEDQSFRMNRGDLCILAPNAMHAISANSDDAVIINIMISKKMFDMSFLDILKSGKVVRNFLEHILYNKMVSPYLIFPTKDDPWMQETVLRVYNERKEKDYLYNESVTLYVKQIFIHIIRHYEMMAIISNPLDHSQENNIVALMGYININYNRVTLKQVAHFFGYNEAYLGQMIQKYTNKTFSALVTNIQMEHAKKLLEESHLSITDVGNEVGCYDSSHFTRKFKNTFGITPKEYRNHYNNCHK